MIKNKYLILSSLMLLTVGLGLLASSISIAYAQSNTNYPPLIQKLIERFNLNTSEVDEVIKEVKNQRHEEMKQNISERLDQAVTDGKITSEQKYQVLAKLEEWHSKKEELMNLTPKERRTKMQEIRTEMETWAEENGIDFSLLFGFGHKMFMKGFHDGHMMGQW